MKNSATYFTGKKKRLASQLFGLLAFGLAMALLAGCSTSRTASADLNSSGAEEAAKVEASRPAPVRVTVPDGIVLSARLLQSISSASARPGDEFDAELADPITVEGKVVFPKGAQLVGRVVSAKKSGRLQDPGRLGLTLKAIELSDGTWTDLKSSNFYAQGQSHKKRNLTLIGGGTGVGALIGGIAGGGKGAAIGALSGAAAGTAGAAATGQKDVTLPVERVLRFTLKSPIAITRQL